MKELLINLYNLQLFADMNTQVTTSEGLTAEMKTYYSNRLIDLVEPELVHDQFAQKHPIPKNGGKTIEFRQWEPLPEMTAALTEGVTPDGQSLSMSTIEATVSQYGGYVTISDMLDLTAIDPVLVQGTKAIASQAGRSLDTITREVLVGGTNVIYSGGVSSREAVADVLTLCLAVPLIRKYENLLVIQTFSKSRSLAGARLGFGIGNAALIADLHTVRYSTNPYNVNRMTAAAGHAALCDNDYYMDNCRTIMENRAYTTEALRDLGFEVLPSLTNFVFAKTDKMSGEALYLELKRRGILVRHFGKPSITDYNRITIGTREQMEAFISTVKTILEELS